MKTTSILTRCVHNQEGTSQSKIPRSKHRVIFSRHTYCVPPADFVNQHRVATTELLVNIEQQQLTLFVNIDQKPVILLVNIDLQQLNLLVKLLN